MKLQMVIKMYHTVIPVALKAAEISAAGQSIYSYDKNRAVVKAYQAFTREVEKPEGSYKMIARHRRKMASELADNQTIQCIARNVGVGIRWN